MKANRTAIVKFKPHILEGILGRNESYLYSGVALTLFQAYIVWLPFSLPGSQVSVLISYTHACTHNTNRICVEILTR